MEGATETAGSPSRGRDAGMVEAARVCVKRRTGRTAGLAAGARSAGGGPGGGLRDDAAPLADDQELIGGDRPDALEALHLRGPADLDRIDPRHGAEADVQAHVVLRQVGA